MPIHYVAAKHRANSRARKFQILLVESNRDVVEIMAKLLENDDHEISMACSGREAIACASQISLHAVYTALILHDLDGFELIARLRELPGTVHTIMIALTGHSRANDLPSRGADNFDFYVRKPPTREELLAPLNAIRRSRQ